MDTAGEEQPGLTPLRSLYLAVGMAAAFTIPACGQDRVGEPAPSTTASSVPATTTSPPSPMTSTIESGQEPIPTDPAMLESCSKLAPNAIRTTPSRWWAAPPGGWDLSYAFSSSSPGSDSSDIGSSLLVQTRDGHVVSASVGIYSIAGEAEDFTSELSRLSGLKLRGVPGAIEPETTRSGPTGALQANWIEDNHSFWAVGSGLDEPRFRSVLEQIGINDGVVTEVPGDWQLLGAGHSDDGADATVLGFTPRHGSLDEYGTAPLEITVQDNASELSGSGTPQVLGDKTGSEVTSIMGRPALTLDRGDGRYSVSTVTGDGHPIDASGPLPAQELLELAGTTERIDPSDPRLVGVAIGNRSDMGEACREDR